MKYSYAPSDAICPVCSAQDARLLYGVTSAQAAQHFVRRERDMERNEALQRQIETVWKQPEAQVVECARCGFCFANPFVAGDARFYELAYPTAGYPGWKWEFQVTVDELRARGLENFRLLEVGAGKGAFVRAIAPEFTPKENVVATEYSPDGRRAIEDYGVKCVAVDVRALPAGTYDGAFDVICLFQVLEHLDRLPELFRGLHRLAARGGDLIVAVPNPVWVTFNELHGALLDMPPNHVGRWNRRAFESLEQYGWRLEQYSVNRPVVRHQVITFCAHSFLRASQNADSWANRIDRVRQPQVRRVLQAGGVAVYGLKNIANMRALTAPDMGAAQWVRLKKIELEN